MDKRIDDLRIYMQILKEGVVNERDIYSNYNYVRNLFEDELILEEIDKFHAAYNTLRTANDLFEKEESNLLKKIGKMIK